jgi:hypothetical protein
MLTDFASCSYQCRLQTASVPTYTDEAGRLYLKNRYHKGVFDLVGKIYKSDAFAGLFRGFTVTCLREG